MSPGDRFAGKTKEHWDDTEKCFCHAVCTVAHEVVCTECMSFYHFFGKGTSYFLLLLCLFLALASICKIARTEAVSCNHWRELNLLLPLIAIKNATYYAVDEEEIISLMLLVLTLLCGKISGTTLWLPRRCECSKHSSSDFLWPCRTCEDLFVKW